MLVEELLLGATCCACVGLFADTLPQAEGGKLTLDVPSGKVTYENAVPTGVTVEKTGAGEAVLAVASVGDGVGAVTVSAGCLTLLHKDALGKNNAIEVKSGATLKLNIPYPTGQNTRTFSSHPLVIAGDGHDGEGCLQYVPIKNGSNTMSDGLFSGDVVLSGDASVKQIAANGRWGFWGNGWDQSSFDLNGHVFTAVGTGNSVLGFGNLRFKNSGAKEDGRLVVRGPTNLKPAAFRIMNTATWATDPDHPGVIVLDYGGVQSNGGDVGRGFGSNWVMRVAADHEASAIYVNNDNQKNTWDGDIDAGELPFRIGTIAHSGGGMYLHNGRIHGKELRIADNAKIRVSFTDNNFCLTNFVSSGGATTTFSGGRIQARTMSLQASTNIFDGGIVAESLPGSDNQFWQINPGALGPVGKMVFKNCTVSRPANSGQSIRLAVDGWQGQAMLVVEDGANITFPISSISARGRAAFIQKGGSIVQNSLTVTTGNREDSPNTGNRGHGRGYFEQLGGSYSISPGNEGGFLVGRYGGHGWVVQRGGTMTFRGSAETVFRLGLAGYGEYAHFGGETVFSDAQHEWQITASASPDDIPVGTEPTTIITVSGAEGRLCAPYGMNTWRTNASALAVLNLRKGGRLETGYFRHASSAFCTSKNPADMTAGQKLFWNFDGGVLAPLKSGTFIDNRLGASVPNVKPNAVTLFDDGIVYDLAAVTNADGSAATWTLGAPLVKATGNGLATITLPADAAFRNQPYMGPARIHVTSSTGHGATALVDFDGEARTARGVIVTCPGCDYGEDTVVEIESATNMTYRFRCAYTLAPNAGTGGIVKRGAGTLKLDAADDFGGALEIDAGRVDVSAWAVFPKTIRMTCAAAFERGAGLVTSGTVDLSNAALVIDDPENLPLYENGHAVICAAAGGVTGQPANACAPQYIIVRRGTSLVFMKSRGTMIIFR